MSRSIKLASRAVACVAAIGVLSAIGASAALAAPASYSPGSGGIAGAGTLTWSVDGGPSVTCPPITISGSNSTTNWAGTLSPAFCNGRTVSMFANYGANTDGAGAYSVSLFAPNAVYTPFGVALVSYPFGTAPWINGNATTPSRIAFSNTKVGSLSNSPLYGTPPYPQYAGRPIRVTGTVTTTTPTGGLVTVN